MAVLSNTSCILGHTDKLCSRPLAAALNVQTDVYPFWLAKSRSAALKLCLKMKLFCLVNPLASGCFPVYFYAGTLIAADIFGSPQTRAMQ